MSIAAIRRDIEQIDEKLSVLREAWLDASPARKENWMTKINQLLDDRLALMKLREKLISL